MKKLSEIRLNPDLRPEEVSSSIKYFKGLNIDWNVYLESKGMNLQRGLVWTLKQKRELIFSILLGRHIPHCAIINTINKYDNKTDIYQIIDGKQRLSTIFDFIDNEFAIEIDSEYYCFDDLPKEYQQAINNFHFRYYIINEPWDTRITDEQKIDWFKFINYVGTPQDEEHLKLLTRKM